MSSDERALDPDLEQLEELVYRGLERAASGGPEALDALLAEHPERAAEVRQRLDALRRAGLVGEGAARERPERLGDFRLLEPLGGGGMGLVYRALQESLGREVALKLIRPEQLYFPGARERFEREVAIVARLSHPGIVPVYSVGEDDGVPYFAMECVEGCTLADALAALEGRAPARLTGADLAGAVCAASGVAPPAELVPLYRGSWVDTALRVMRQVAEALEHAHSLGVLHRDLKPSNVMLTPGGRVMLLDFGLSASGGTSSLTRSGAQLGSLPYLPPERVAEGAPFDRRSDVYGLGATLYELLSLELPFQGKSEPELMSAIAAAQPTSVRALNKAVPWDAETVCQVAMERDPARRYAGAGAFARDLTNVLERRPIAARRTSLVLRARRRVQRHPGWAAAGLLAFVAPTVFAVQQWRSAQREVRANVRLSRESALAAEFLGKSLDAIQEVLVMLGHDETRDVPLFARKREELLERALELYEEIAQAERSTEGRAFEQLEGQRLQAAVAVGSLYSEMRRPEAEAMHRRVLADGAARAARLPGDWLALSSMARAHQGLAAEASLRGDLEGAIAACAEGFRVLEGVDAADRFRWPVARALVNLDHERAKALFRSGRIDAALTAIRRSRAYADENVGHDPRDVQVRQLRTAMTVTLGGILVTAGLHDEAEEVLLDGIDEVREIEPDTSAVVALLDTRVKMLTNLGSVYFGTGRGAEAEECFTEALEVQESLARSFPEAPQRTADLANSLRSLSIVLAGDGARRAEALSYAQRSVAEQRVLVERFPEPRYVGSLGAAHGSAGHLLVQLDRPLEALESFRAGIAAQERALAASPGHPAFVPILADHHLGLADALLGLQRWSEAAPSVRASLTTLADAAHLREATDRLLRCAEQSARDETLAPDARVATAAAFVDEAFAALIGAVDAGYADLADWTGSPTLAPLREREGFLELQRRVEQAAARRGPE
jgi:hypothetical protein